MAAMEEHRARGEDNPRLWGLLWRMPPASAVHHDAQGAARIRRRASTDQIDGNPWPEAGQMRPGARYRTSLVKFVGWGRDVMPYEHPGELATPEVSVAHVLD